MYELHQFALFTTFTFILFIYILNLHYLLHLHLYYLYSRCYIKIETLNVYTSINIIKILYIN